MKNSIVRIFYKAVLVATSSVAAFGVETTPRPNVVIILADDQGWGDLSTSGNLNLSTYVPSI